MCFIFLLVDDDIEHTFAIVDALTTHLTVVEEYKILAAMTTEKTILWK